MATGARMFYNTQEILLRRKLEEQADLQQAIELQGRRLINLQLLDLKNHTFSPHQYFRGLSSGSPLSSPTLSRTPTSNTQSIILSPDAIKDGDSKENCGDPDAAVSGKAAADASPEVYSTCQDNGGNASNSNEEQGPKTEESYLHESLEHILPDNLFTSPKKSAGDHLTVFSTASVEVDGNNTSPTTSSSNNNPLISTTNSALDVHSLKSCFLQMPRFPPGHGAIGI
uniref:Nucleic acid binding protein n=1 Tax=Rhizophora mucronata TaxID=61149 RepID=A0A2P2JS18_RHIMU